MIGIIASQYRAAGVPVDVTAPVITLVGGNVTIEEGIPYSDPGFSAFDDMDGDITANVVVGYGGLDINDPEEGVYTITYNVSDAAGNPAIQKSRTVTVEPVSAATPASYTEGNFSPHSAIYGAEFSTINWHLYLPEGYGDNPNTLYPIFFFCHGLGELGTNNNTFLMHGPHKVIRNGGTMLTAAQMQAKGYDGAIWVAVQQPKGHEFTQDHWNNAFLHEIIQYHINNYQVDTDRIYLTGLSMGSAGVTHYASEYPTIAAAIVPIAGKYVDSDVNILKNTTETWIVCAANDGTGGNYGIGASQDAYNSMSAISSPHEVKFTKPATGGHGDGTWGKVYRNEVLTSLQSPGLDPMGGDTTVANNWAMWCKSKFKISPPVAFFDVDQDETGVLLNSNFVITLNEAIRGLDDSELTNANIATKVLFDYSTDGGSTWIPLAKTVTISVDKKVVSVNPDADMIESRLHRIGIVDIEDSRDNAAADQIVTFTTESTSTYVEEHIIKINFENEWNPSPATYNDFGDVTNLSFVRTNITNMLGQGTGIGATIIDAFNGGGNQGSPGSSPVYPAQALQGGWTVVSWGDNTGVLEFNNLNPAKYYHIEVTGYKNVANSFSKFTINDKNGDQAQTLAISNNLSNACFFDDLQCDANGKLRVKLQRDGGADTAVMSLMHLTVSNLPKP